MSHKFSFGLCVKPNVMHLPTNHCSLSQSIKYSEQKNKKKREKKVMKIVQSEGERVS